jgi:predicted cupin superfamily sugar epimerase
MLQRWKRLATGRQPGDRTGDAKTTRIRPTAGELIGLWRLAPMALENLLFARTYVAPDLNADGKPAYSAIVAMVTSDPATRSEMHRLPTDELWHFYLGDPIELLLLYADGHDELVILGQDVFNGQRIQMLVPKGVCMGARLRPGGEYGVFGNTMAPGFVPGDFDRVPANELLPRWPHRRELILALTRDETGS